MNNIVKVFHNGRRYFFKVNSDLTISRSLDCRNWEVIDFIGQIGMEANEVSSIRNSGELTSIELKTECNRLIMVTDLGNYVAEGGNVIGDTWIPC